MVLLRCNLVTQTGISVLHTWGVVEAQIEMGVPQHCPQRCEGRGSVNNEENTCRQNFDKAKLHFGSIPSIFIKFIYFTIYFLYKYNELIGSLGNPEKMLHTNN